MANSFLGLLYSPYLPSPVLARSPYVSNNTIAAYSPYGSMRDNQRTAVVSKQYSKAAAGSSHCYHDCIDHWQSSCVVCVSVRVPREVVIFELRPIIVRCESTP